MYFIIKISGCKVHDEIFTLPFEASGVTDSSAMPLVTVDGSESDGREETLVLTGVFLKLDVDVVGSSSSSSSPMASSPSAFALTRLNVLIISSSLQYSNNHNPLSVDLTMIFLS